MTRLGRFYEKIVEIGWLAAVAATPMYFNVYSSRVFEPDKATVLRSIMLLTAAAFLLAQFERWRSRIPDSDTQPIGPRSPLLLPALALAGVQIVATVASIAPHISWWGSYMRLQGTYTFLAYLTLFLIMVASLHRREQVDRLLTVVLLVSAPISAYGVVQFLHRDPLPWGGDVTARVTSSLGNAIFLGAYLIMVAPLTLSRLVGAVRRWRSEPPTTAQEWEASTPSLIGRVALVLLMIFFPAFLVAINMQSLNLWWSAVPAVVVFVLLGVLFAQPARLLPPLIGVASYGLLFLLQLSAVFLTQSRGPWLGLAAGLVCFVSLLALRERHRRLLRAAIAVVIPAGLLLVIFNLPIAQLEPLKQTPYIGRFGSIADIERGTGRVRWLIWQGSVELLRDRPSPGLQPDNLSLLRPLIGYGPDVMALASNKVYQPALGQLEARNASPDRNHMNLLDHLVMTGLLGLIFYLALVAVALRTGWIYLQKADQPRSQLALIGVISGLVAHLVESQVGIVIVATWTYFWVYLALIARAPAWTAGTATVIDEAPAPAPQSAPNPAPASARSRRRKRAQPEAPPRPVQARPTGGPWYWVAGYVGLTALGILASLAMSPVDEARTGFGAAYAWAALGLVVGGLYLSGTGAGAQRMAPLWSGGWEPAAVLVVALLIVVPVTIVNMDVVSADIFYKRGMGTDSQNRWDISIQHYQKALRLAPDQDWYHIFLGRAFLALAEQRNPKQAGAPPIRITARQLIAMDPRALAPSGKDDLLEAARVIFEQARELNPLNADHYANLGRMHRFWGEALDRSHLDDSVRYFQMATTVSPRTAHLQDELARTHLIRGEVEPALRILEYSRQLDPTFATTFALLGDTYLMLQRYDEGLANHAKAMEIDPGSLAESGSEQRFIRYIDAGKGNELDAAIRRVVEKHPNNAIAHSTYGFILSRMGRIQEALAQYKTNVELSPRDWVGHRNMAVSYQQLGMLSEAVASAQSALQYAPESQKKPIQDFIAQLQAAQGVRRP